MVYCHQNKKNISILDRIIFAAKTANKTTMYKFSYFQEADKNKVIEFMQANSFALLTGMGDDYPVVTQVPLSVNIVNGHLELKGHLMKNTDHHKAFLKNNRVMVVFTGPHCYVSARWYTDPQTASTWNYMTVQVKGKIIFTDEAGTREAIEAVTNYYEAPESPAAYKNIPEEYIARLVKAITGFYIEVDSVDHVFKLSQNKTADEQQKIVDELMKQGDYNSVAIAAAMKSQLT